MKSIADFGINAVTCLSISLLLFQRHKNRLAKAKTLAEIS
jgi:hypothetical protein